MTKNKIGPESIFPGDLSCFLFTSFDDEEDI